MCLGFQHYLSSSLYSCLISVLPHPVSCQTWHSNTKSQFWCMNLYNFHFCIISWILTQMLMLSFRLLIFSFFLIFLVHRKDQIFLLLLLLLLLLFRDEETRAKNITHCLRDTQLEMMKPRTDSRNWILSHFTLNTFLLKWFQLSCSENVNKKQRSEWYSERTISRKSASTNPVSKQ